MASMTDCEIKISKDVHQDRFILTNGNVSYCMSSESLISDTYVSSFGADYVSFAYNFDKFNLATSTSTEVDWEINSGEWTSTAGTYTTSYSQVKKYEEKVIHDGTYNICIGNTFETFEAPHGVITEDDLALHLESIKRERFRKMLQEKRVQIRIKKAENKGLRLLERFTNEEQIENYKLKGFVDIEDVNGNICRIFGDDSRKIEVFEKKKKIVIAKDLSTIDKLNKMDEFILNGESFVMTKKLCTHHKASEMPNVDGVISKIAWLRSGQKYEDFSNIYKVA